MTRIIWKAETGSTNDDARDLALAGEKGPLWLAARRQTKGRGRQGRIWESPAGNLYTTLLWQPAAPPEHLAELSFAGALAVLRMMQHFLPARERGKVSLKWPNDVLLGGGKTAGLLLEAGGSKSAAWIALGIGVNLVYAPKQTLYPAACLADFAPAPSADDALEVLAAQFAELASLWDKGQGFAHLRELWLEHAKGVGEEITVRLPDETLEGRFAALEKSGALRLEQKNKPDRLIYAGDVFLKAKKL